MKFLISILLTISAVACFSQATIKVRVHTLQMGSTPVGPSTDTVAKFNFAGSVGAAVADWVTFYGTPHSAITTATDNRSGSNIVISSVASGYSYWGAPSTAVSNSGGETVANPTFRFPASVLASRWFVSSTNRDTTLSNLKISGLDPGHTYRIEIIASRLTGSVPESAQTASFKLITTSQNMQRSLNAKGNTANVASFAGVVPKFDGTVDGYVNYVDATFANINALIIIEE